MFKEQISIIYVLYVIFTHPYNLSWSDFRHWCCI